MAARCCTVRTSWPRSGVEDLLDCDWIERVKAGIHLWLRSRLGLAPRRHFCWPAAGVGAWHRHRCCRAGDLTLLLVVERQTKGITKGHQRSLHGVGFGLLDGGLMGLAQVDIDAVAGAGAFPNQKSQVTGSDSDADPGGYG